MSLTNDIFVYSLDKTIVGTLTQLYKNNTLWDNIVKQMYSF